MSTTPKELQEMSLAELKKLVAEKEQTEKDVLNTEIETLQATLADKKAQLLALTGAPAPVVPTKRSKTRKFSMISTKLAKLPKKAKGKRGAVGAAILAYLASKGKTGAKIADIAAATGNKPANVTAFFYVGAGKKAAKRIAPATFALKK